MSWLRRVEGKRWLHSILPEAASWGQQDATSDAQNEKAHGALGHQADADGRADADPPPRVVGPQKTDDKIGRKDPPDVVEGRIGKKRAGKEGIAGNGAESFTWTFA